MAQESTKDALLAELRDERDAWDALLGDVGDTRFGEAGIAGDWSVRDVIGHLTAYYRYWGAQVNGIVSGRPPTPREMFDVDALPETAGQMSLDEMNAAIHAQQLGFSEDEIRSRWRDVNERLITGITMLSEDDLTTPGRFPWAEGGSLLEPLAGSTVRHARSHREEALARVAQWSS